MLYVIVYLWRGERHRDSKAFASRKDAAARLAEFTADGWQAWMERVR